uniref:Uncharacterized protein n=1 Tax=Romanomermis culicivorax TaxID=13658 RepID=A0A915L3V9_ROMCU
MPRGCNIFQRSPSQRNEKFNAQCSKVIARQESLVNNVALQRMTYTFMSFEGEMHDAKADYSQLHFRVMAKGVPFAEGIFVRLSAVVLACIEL